jgi:DNA-binding transcriptional MocR family regulator
VVGEVGRGTFVAGETSLASASPEPPIARIDLEFNYPLLPGQSAMIAKSLQALQRPEVLDIILRPASSIGTQAARISAGGFLGRGGWTPAPDRIVFTGNGRQSIAAALAAVVPAGGRCGVEALTYPFVKGIAARLGITLVPLAMDEDGVRPDAVQRAHREAKLSALYIQPVMHNPLGMTMPPQRRTELLRVVDKLGLIVIEDAVYAFLDDIPPLAAEAPDRCIVLDSLSKKVAPGLALGFIAAPPALRESLMAAVRSGGWTASGYLLAAGQKLIDDGTAAELTRLKREDAVRRQQLASTLLAGFTLQANSRAYHLWLNLPPHWRSQELVAAAARRDIAVTPSTTFAAAPGHAPNAVRLALGAPTLTQLEHGLQTLAGILKAREEDFDTTE